MLILTRRMGETVKIGDNIAVTICAINGNTVRVGVTAPRQLSVHREEIYKRVKQEAMREPER